MTTKSTRTTSPQSQDLPDPRNSSVEDLRALARLMHERNLAGGPRRSFSDLLAVGAPGLSSPKRFRAIRRGGTLLAALTLSLALSSVAFAAFTAGRMSRPDPESAQDVAAGHAERSTPRGPQPGTGSFESLPKTQLEPPASLARPSPAEPAPAQPHSTSSRGGRTSSSERSGGSQPLAAPTPAPNGAARPRDPQRGAPQLSPAPTPAESSDASSPGPEQSTADPSIAAAVDQALAGPSESEARRALPEVPTRSEVRSTLRAVGKQLAQCTDHQGLVRVRLTVDGPRGRVSTVDVTTPLDAASTRCVARKVRQAEFEPFARKRFEIEFPFVTG